MTLNQRRMTHEYEGELVVFLIGMRINKPWRPDLWLPVFNAMPGMLRELAADTESGMLGSRAIMDPRGPWLVQYWNSVDKLYDYASNSSAHHRPAWTRFNRLARKAPAAVGVWHETFTVAQAESIYVGMPKVSGLAKATTSIPVTRRLDRARDRIDS